MLFSQDVRPPLQKAEGSIQEGSLSRILRRTCNANLRLQGFQLLVDFESERGDLEYRACRLFFREISWGAIT